jgi:predicted RNase H-like HicB family nuclease
MILTVDYEKDNYGRWIAQVSQLPSVEAYGETPQEAQSNIESLASREFSKLTDHNCTLKFVHRHPEIQELFDEASLMPYTYRNGWGSDWDVAAGPYGTTAVDVPRNPEDRQE